MGRIVLDILGWVDTVEFLAVFSMMRARSVSSEDLGLELDLCGLELAEPEPRVATPVRLLEVDGTSKPAIRRFLELSCD